jgi:EAL domain-containing protein (putative c-di-GMP-specific phosphodiesterase class I)
MIFIFGNPQSGCGPAGNGRSSCHTKRAALSSDITGYATGFSLLRGLGFHIALDDFGTGHCGFNYLKTLPIGSIKIDRSYIRSLAYDQVAQIFVSALAQIARIQNVAIVAEGVETAEEFAMAKAVGCSRFQGYFFSRPVPRNKIGRLSIDAEPMPLALSARDGDTAPDSYFPCPPD